MTMGRSLLSTATIFAVLLIAGGNIAFAQKQTPTRPRPTTAESAEWERMLEGLKKAKPMPEPSHLATPKTVTPHEGLAGFDPKTGEVTNLPAAEAQAPTGLQHKDRKPDAQPKNASGGKPH
jgi:hypothetical protein